MFMTEILIEEKNEYVPIEEGQYDQLLISAINLLYEYSSKRIANRENYNTFVDNCESHIAEMYIMLSQEELQDYGKFVNKVRTPQLKEIVKGVREVFESFGTFLFGKKQDAAAKTEVKLRYTPKIIAEVLEFYLWHGSKNRELIVKKSKKKEPEAGNPIETAEEKKARERSEAIAENYELKIRPRVADLALYVRENIKQIAT